MEILEKQAPFVSRVLKGVGQIMLQDNVWTGLLFLVGIFYDSWQMGVGAVLATCLGTLTAQVLKYDKDEINMGLYGFSPALVGVALTAMFEESAAIWVAIIIGSILAAVVQHIFIVKKIPVFTLPFILITWIIVFILHSATNIPASPAISDPSMFAKELNDFGTSTYGFGEVIFQGSFLAGVLFFIGVFIGNPVASLYGLAASITAVWLALMFDEPLLRVHVGLFSYNAVLCAIVFAGTERKDGLIVLISCILTVLIEVYLLKLDIVPLTKAGGVLTFPFVAATWLTLPIKKIIYSLIE